MLKANASVIGTPARTEASPEKRHQRRDAPRPNDKENQRPDIDGLADNIAGISLAQTDIDITKAGEKCSHSIYESDDPAVQAEKARHQRFTEEALDMVSSPALLPCPQTDSNRPDLLCGRMRPLLAVSSSTAIPSSPRA